MKPMKISEAIRKGCEMLPKQAFGGFYNEDGTASCALGAAMDGAGLTMCLLGEWAKQLSELKIPCGCDPIKVSWNKLAHLNDDHRWSREQIADWLEIQEKEFE